MAVSVVEFLEMIDIEDQQQHGLVIPAGPLQLMCAGFQKGAPVEGTGERIGGGHCAQAQLSLAQCKGEAVVGHHEKAKGPADGHRDGGQEDETLPQIRAEGLCKAGRERRLPRAGTRQHRIART